MTYLHHYFNSDNSIKCNDLNLHYDKCRGQNKNNDVGQYLSYRTLKGLNSNIELSFMLLYHTRFDPDWCFGLVKLKYKHSYISFVARLAEAVLLSTIKEINIPQLISDPSSGNSI